MKRNKKKGTGAPGADGTLRHGGADAGDRGLAADLCRWFAVHARDLPWRENPRNPYHSLVSEVMLQQTQVSRVVERFGAFVARFPTASALAAAGEGDVLAEWSGLGYYRRAVLLHRAARQIELAHGGRVPDDEGSLAALPGVGRYTAGAVASICFGRAVPIVDGNVKRVLMRLGARRGAQSGAAVERWAWARAGGLVRAAAGPGPSRPGAFNEALMELGATVCTPKAPRCGECPVRGRCGAYRLGVQDRIPPAKPRAERRALVCVSVIAQDRSGRLLVERRPGRGLWAGMWQAPTVEGAAAPREAEVAAIVGGLDPGREVARFRHGTTHRDVLFIVRRLKFLGPRQAKRAAGTKPDRRWLMPEQIGGLALSNPQRKILLTIGGARDGVS